MSRKDTERRTNCAGVKSGHSGETDSKGTPSPPAEKLPIAMLAQRPIKIRKVDDARKLLARAILAFQKGQLDNRDAKDLCYLLSQYVSIATQITTQIEIEDRLRAIEEKLEVRK